MFFSGFLDSQLNNSVASTVIRCHKSSCGLLENLFFFANQLQFLKKGSFHDRLAKRKETKKDSHVFRLFPLPRFPRFTKAISRRVWNVCWIPLASIRTVASDTSNEGDFLGDGRCGEKPPMGDEHFEPPNVEADGR